MCATTGREEPSPDGAAAAVDLEDVATGFVFEGGRGVRIYDEFGSGICATGFDAAFPSSHSLPLPLSLDVGEFSSARSLPLPFFFAGLRLPDRFRDNFSALASLSGLSSRFSGKRGVVAVLVRAHSGVT